MASRPWLVPTVAAIAWVALLVAGVVVWRMTGYAFSLGHCAPGRLLCHTGTLIGEPYRLHPLRAELLWATSAVFALVAVGAGLRQWRRRSAVAPVAG